MHAGKLSMKNKIHNFEFGSRGGQEWSYGFEEEARYTVQEHQAVISDMFLQSARTFGLETPNKNRVPIWLSEYVMQYMHALVGRSYNDFHKAF